MKRMLLALLVPMVLLTGCSDTTELADRAVIQALAVDCEKGVYRVSALMFSSGDTIDASQENVIKVTGEGAALSEAVDKISLIDGKEIFLRETKLLILGSGFENADVINVLNTLYFDMRCSLNLSVCCAENAEAVTDIHFSEGITAAEKPLSIIENAHRTGVSPKTTLLDLLSDNNCGKTTPVPFFTLTQNGSGMTTDDSETTIEISGTCNISEGKIQSYNTLSETIGLLIVAGECRKLPLNLIYNGKEYSCIARSITVSSDVQDGETALKVTAVIRDRNGKKLPPELERAAMDKLVGLIRNVM